MGYQLKRSKPSLIAGTVSGILLFIAAWLIPLHFTAGLILGLVVSLLLAGKFIPDFIHKKSFFPAGLMSILSVVSIILTLLAFYR